MNGFARAAARVYRVLLACYPAEFRSEFGIEMHDVFETELKEVLHSGKGTILSLIGREFRGWLVSALREHLNAWRFRMTNKEPFQSLKPIDTLAALTIFILPILTTLLSTLLHDANLGGVPDLFGIIFVVVFLGSLTAPFIYALIRGLPRWSPPYLGVLLVGLVFFGPFWPIVGVIYPTIKDWIGPFSSWSLTQLVLYQGLQGIIIWLLVLLAAWILVSVARFWSHTRTIWEITRKDWTLLSFFLYGGIILDTILVFDEYQGDEPWMLAAFLCLGIGCWLYLRAPGQKQRFIILLTGATLAMWIVAVGKWVLVPSQNWGPWFESHPTDETRWFESLSMIANWLCLMVAMLVPPLINMVARMKISDSQQDITPI